MEINTCTSKYHMLISTVTHTLRGSSFCLFFVCVGFLKILILHDLFLGFTFDIVFFFVSFIIIMSFDILVIIYLHWFC